MEAKDFHGAKIFVDDITRELTARYPLRSYRGLFGALGVSEYEGLVAKSMFIARTCNEYVGIDFSTYQKRFPGEQYYDSLDEDFVRDEDDFQYYIGAFEEEIGFSPFRIALLGGRKVYIITEDAIRCMLRGQLLESDEEDVSPGDPRRN